MQSSGNSCTILVLTYKGKHHLELLLPTIKQAIENFRGEESIDVLIVDNGSDELTKEFVLSQYPNFRYEFSPDNDYLFSLNRFVKALSTDYLLMLNDDMKLDENVLNLLLPCIEKDKSLFAVTCRIMDFEGKYTASAVRAARYTKGWMYNAYLDPSETEIKYTLYPGGGAAVFRTEYFNALDGFDPLFRPAYCEDTDLGIRAWQQGWSSIYYPAAILYHREGGTITDQFKKDKLEQTINKNKILCTLKNTRFPGFLFWFYILLPYRIIRSLVKDKIMFNAWKLSFKQFPQALAKRRSARVLVMDPEWIGLLNKPYPKQKLNG